MPVAWAEGRTALRLAGLRTRKQKSGRKSTAVRLIRRSYTTTTPDSAPLYILYVRVTVNSQTHQLKPINLVSTPPPTALGQTLSHFGLTTDVVSDPLSTYTPLKNQSSAPVPSFPGRGSLKTPKCQSAALLDVLAAKGPAVLTNVLLPVECQNETCLDEKFFLLSAHAISVVSVVISQTNSENLGGDSQSHTQHCATHRP